MLSTSTNWEHDMKLLITGGAGFLGARLARTLLAKGELAGAKLTQVVLADQFPAPADLAADPRVQVLTGPLLEQCSGFAQAKFDGVFHLASAVSGECEADFDLGMRSNLDSTRALLDALRAAGNKPRVLFSSSVAVYGPDPAHPLPDRHQTGQCQHQQGSGELRRHRCHGK
jgi:nucleoside-diphosphate-sugar epimerase